MSYTDYIIPVIVVLIVSYGLYKKVNIFDEFIIGAREGLNVAISIIPALVALVTIVAMLKVSGLINVLSFILSPLTNLLGIPKEVLPLGLIRPISGSGALVVFQNLLTTYGADSYIGRVASVLQGSTETTFYTIAVYFGANQIKKIRHTVYCALLADFTSLVLCGIIIRLFYR